MTESATTNSQTCDNHVNQDATTASLDELVEQGMQLIRTTEEDCRMALVKGIQDLLGQDETKMYLANGEWIYFHAFHKLIEVKPKKFHQAVEEIAFELLQRKGFEIKVKHKSDFFSEIYFRAPQPQKSLLQKLLGGLSSWFQTDVLT
jgi:hypothetical protein